MRGHFLKGAAVAFSVLLLQSPIPAYAKSMHCKLTEVLTLTDDGIFEANPFEADYVENDLVVDMSTGTIYHGKGFGNEAYPIKTILDAGSPSSSFKLVSTSVPRKLSKDTTFANTVYLQIYTLADGVKKPFLVAEGRNVGTGLCQ